MDNPKPMCLRYDSPAKQWVEALPLGNGRLGVMAFGDISEERYALNEDTLWSGYPRDKNNPHAREHLDEVTALALAGKYVQAHEIIREHMLGGDTDSYMPLGDLWLEHAIEGVATGYRRTLDLESATSGVAFEADGVCYERTCFVSAPDQSIVIRLTADQPGRINVRARLASQLRHDIVDRSGLLCLDGIAPSIVAPPHHPSEDPVFYSDVDAEKGMRFCAQLGATTRGGSVRIEGDALVIEGADEATLVLGARTGFRAFDALPYLDGVPTLEPCEDDVRAALARDYVDLLERHVGDYRSYYARVSLDIGGDDRSDALSTLDRLRRFQDAPDDAGLYALLFQFGRYLLISSSRPGTQPANLQGIWNQEMRPPWRSNYTMNINTEMNYWPAESTNLSEMHAPLFSLIQDLRITGKHTAQVYYGANGFVSHHNCDLWRMANPSSGMPSWAFWPSSAAWLCEHLFEHYAYTKDIDFLRDTAYPTMKEAAAFYLDLLRLDENGYLVLAPATSPENHFFVGEERVSTAKTTTMTMTILKELLTNLIESARILGVDAAYADRLRITLDRLYPFQIGSKGQLLEWSEELPETEPTHRHISHLYGLHPARLITPEGTPELAAAVRRSLELRGDDGTGWSLGWKISQWARLFEGDHALKLLQMQLRLVDTGDTQWRGGGTYPNLFDAHPPFQIDGNFAATAGIAEMLLQSYGTTVHVLPALPSAWESGTVRGLRAKGGLVVSIHWEGGVAKAVRLEATCDAHFTLRGFGQPIELFLQKGAVHVLGGYAW